jgi:enolase-like protein
MLGCWPFGTRPRANRSGRTPLLRADLALPDRGARPNRSVRELNHSAAASPVNRLYQSRRSGGVTDDVVMDLAVGLGVPFQKNGARRSGERIAKLNFLLRAAEGIPNCALANVPALVRFFARPDEVNFPRPRCSSIQRLREVPHNPIDDPTLATANPEPTPTTNPEKLLRDCVRKPGRRRGRCCGSPSVNNRSGP